MTTTDAMLSLWRWLRENDLPNWLIFAFTAVLWPLALFAWQRRRVTGVAGLDVNFVTGQITIDGKAYPAVDIHFTNHTGSVAYIRGVRVRDCTKRFYVPPAAARDIARNSYQLKFNDGAGHFLLREITLQTNGSAQTCMPSALMPLEFFQHSLPWYARKLRRRKYFTLEYTAMVGTTRHSVATAY